MKRHVKGQHRLLKTAQIDAQGICTGAAKADVEQASPGIAQAAAEQMRSGEDRLLLSKHEGTAQTSHSAQATYSGTDELHSLL